MAMRLAIIGASGVTGGFAFDAAERLGLAPIVVGRDGPGLATFARAKALEPARIRIADAHDPAALRAAMVGVTHVVSAVAPFARHGFEIARAAAELGLGYTDSTGEASFMLRMIDELDAVARRTGASLCTGNGISAFVGDAATSSIARRDDAGAAVTLVYDIRDYRPTWGTLESYLTSIMPGGGPAIVDGEVVLRPLGAGAGSACGIAGIHGIFPDPIVISRYWRPRRLDVLIKAPAWTRPIARAVVATAIRPGIARLISRLPLRRWTAYDAANDLKSTVTVHAEVIGGDGRRACRAVTARGIYPATGQIMVATLQAMARRGAARPAGVRAASEMFAGFEEILELADVTERRLAG